MMCNRNSLSDEEKLPAAPGASLQGIGSDPLDELLLEMFLKKDVDSLATLGDADPGEQLSDAFTEEELEALTLLDSSEVLTDVVAREPLPTARQLELPTLSQSAETIAEQESASCGERSKQDFININRSLDRFAKQDHVTFRGEYCKVTEVGRGGQGSVYRIEGEDEFAAVFALKVFLPDGYESLVDFIADMNRMQRIASLIHHQPHDDLVDIGWFGQRDGVYWMLMQYIDGFDLRRLLQPRLLQWLKHCIEAKRWDDINNVVYSVNGSQRLALKPAIAVYIIERVLRGLEALHSRNIIHGDIKPSNIMLNASGCVKIIDTGSAFECNSPPRRHHFTPAYVAPEFLDQGMMSKQSDLASVGFMLIELLSGKPITDILPDPDKSTRKIDAEMRQELLKAKRSLPDRLQDILPSNILASDHLVELCRRLIDPDLNQRFPTAAEGIINRKGTYEFNKDLMLAGLGVCNYYEISQWLANVKQATQRAQENSLPE